MNPATQRRRNHKQVVSESVQMLHDPPEPPMRVLHRFTKPGGHWADIRLRNVNQFDALEFDVFVDGVRRL